MNLSITTILWGKLHTFTEFRRVLREARDIGYDGMGLETRLLPLEVRKNPRVVGKTLKTAKIENAGAYSTMKPSDIDWASKSGTHLLWVVARGDRSYSESVKALGEMLALADEAGVVVALHNHLGTSFETASQLRRVLKELKGLRVCLDTAHAEAVGLDSGSFIREHRERIALIHAKDLRVKVSKSKVSITRDFVNVGTGVVDFGRVFDALNSVGYKGSIMLEIEALVGRGPDELAKEGYDSIREFSRRL